MPQRHCGTIGTRHQVGTPSAGQVNRGIADGNDQIECRDFGRKRVEIAQRVGLGKLMNGYSTLNCCGLPFICAVSVLQIDKLRTANRQHIAPLGQFGGAVPALFRSAAAEPGDTDFQPGTKGLKTFTPLAFLPRVGQQISLAGWKIVDRPPQMIRHTTGWNLRVDSDRQCRRHGVRFSFVCDNGHCRERSGQQLRQSRMTNQNALVGQWHQVRHARGELNFIADALFAVDQQRTLRQRCAVPARL